MLVLLRGRVAVGPVRRHDPQPRTRRRRRGPAVLAGTRTAAIRGLRTATCHLQRRLLGAFLPRAGGCHSDHRPRGILRGAPYLMRGLSVAGTVAMFLVGGGILVHGLPPLHHFSEAVAARGGLVGGVGPTLVGALAGVVAGGLAVGVAKVAGKLFGKKR